MLIRLYGPVELDTGAATQRVAAPKRACVLAALAEAPGVPVSTVDLMNRVWGAQAPEAAISTLYSYIARLRALLRHHPRLRIDRLAAQGYVLRVDPEAVDVHHVRALAARARRHRDRGETAEAVRLWRRGCELARGEALVGVGGPWAADYRAGLRRERLQLLTERYTGELELGHHADAVGELAEAVAREPLFEPLTARYLLALYRCGRAAEALDHYEELRVRLREHSGADPSAELRGLHQAMLRQDASLDPLGEPISAPPVPVAMPTVPAQLPADTAGFRGREAELTAITTRAEHGGVVVIDGMAGVGKTALALRAAHRLAPRYPDGQLFVDLHGYAENLAPATPATALARLLRSLDAEVPEDVEERAAALRTALAGRRMLLVLDNARDAEQVRPLLPGTAECLTVVTARRRLVELVDTRSVSLSTLALAEAAALFAAEAEVAVDAEATRVAALCGGLPLAVRIAASRLRHRPEWDAAELARRLSSGRSTIRELDGAGRGVTAAFELSYRELTEAARRQFRLLSVFPGSEFEVAAAAALAGVEPREAEPLLELLVDAQLLSGLAAGRYRMHDLLREYATQLVEATGEREAAWQRLARHWLAVLHAAATVLEPRMTELAEITPGREHPAPDNPAEWIRAELPALERMVTTAADHDRVVFDLNRILVRVLLARVTPDDMTVRITLAREGERTAIALGDRETRARMAAQLGAVHLDLGMFDEGHAHHSRALGIWRAADDRVGVALTRNNLARVALYTGRYAEAAREFRAAADDAEAAGHAGIAALSRINAVAPLCRLGRVDEAEALLTPARAAAIAADDRYELQRANQGRGLIASRRGDHDAAATWFGGVADFCRRHWIPRGLLFALSGLADVASARGDHAGAAEHAHDQLEALSATEINRAHESRALCQLGAARTGLGEYDDAMDALRAAEQLAREVRAEVELADTRRALGDLHRLRDEPAEARAAYRRALDFYAEGGFPDAAAVRRALAALGG